MTRFYAFLFVIAQIIVSCSQTKEVQDQPNIIFFLADDMRWDALGSAGNSIVETPYINSLANQGIQFKNAFVTTSICCTSRASILTGQYASRTGIWDFNTPLSDSAFAETYPMLLKDNGYQVGFVGKYGIGKNTDNVSGKFDYFWGTSTQPKYENVDENGDYIHYTDLVDKHIGEFFDEVEEGPFCLSVSFKAPHVEDGDPRQFIYNPRFEDLYQEDVIPKEPTNTLAEWEKFPEFFKENNEARRRWKLRFSEDEQYQQSVKGYYRLITGLDEVVGKTQAILEKKGLSENTIIIFTSDNGFYLGEHGLAGKWYPHEPSIRIPMIIYDPRNQETFGTQIEEMALNIDIAPTILSIAGIKRPVSMQGDDLTQLISSENNKPWRDSFYYEHMIFQFPTIPPSQALRTSRYKYIVYPETSPVYEELYDLQVDKAEVNNLAGDPGRDNLLKELRNQLDLLKSSLE